MPTHPTSQKLTKRDMFGNDARIIDKSYLQRNFVHLENVTQDLMDETVHKFKLNSEQEQAFHIVANHATTSNSKKLKMYLGGMGGTGKSQVIKALVYFFYPEKGRTQIF